MDNLTILGRNTLQNILDFIKDCHDSIKTDINKYGIGSLVDEYIYSLETLAAYWLYVYDKDSLTMLDFYEKESDSIYIFETMYLKFTFTELREYLKKCIKN